MSAELRIRDRARIEQFFRRDERAHIYPLGDLDEYFWPDTTWFALETDGGLSALALLLEGLRLPVFYAVCPPGHEPTQELLERLETSLPPKFYGNLGPHLQTSLARRYRFEHIGTYFKMFLEEYAAAGREEALSTVRLTSSHLTELQRFYDHEAYLPEEAAGRFFEPYMLERWPYYAVREQGRLVSAGGVHLVSDRYGVAALGNIATRPDRRRQGFGRQIPQALCQALIPRVPLIGLIVDVRKHTAIRCYERLGFRMHCRYQEGIFYAKT